MKKSVCNTNKIGIEAARLSRLTIPASLFSSLFQSNVLRVQHNDVNYYLSWYAGPAPDNSGLCLSATFARTLNIKEGDEVFVSCAEEAPPLTSVVVAPKSSHDREILVCALLSYPLSLSFSSTPFCFYYYFTVI